ncbi:hypothetical protein LT493_40350 [Streptomyces tricolor]|nr:hypothetical protein [Streptomyces tricolor]
MTDPDVDIDAVRRRIGMVFQQFNLFPAPERHREPHALPQRRVLRRDKETAAKIAAENLARVGLAREGGRLPVLPLRRPAAARRHRPRARHGPRGDALRRADLRARPRAGRRRPRRHAPARPRGHDDDGRHPRDDLRPRGRRPGRLHGRRRDRRGRQPRSG